MNEIADLIGSFGIPAGIAVYLIYWVTTKLNRQLEQLNIVMRDNTAVLRELKTVLENKD